MCVFVCVFVDDAEACKRRMNAASALIGGLGGEKERWTEQSKMFQAQLTKYIIQFHMIVVNDLYISDLWEMFYWQRDSYPTLGHSIKSSGIFYWKLGRRN